MRFFCLAALLASATAFTSQSAAFTTSSPAVGGAFNDVVAAPASHANRRATIVMDGKANGTFSDETRVRHNGNPKIYRIFPL